MEAGQVRRCGRREIIAGVEDGCAEEMGRFLDNSIFRQVTELHVAKCLPWANHCDICAKSLHARDVVAEAENG